MFLSYHNRASTKRYSSCLFSPHTAGTSGTTCVGLTTIAYLRHAVRSAHLATLYRPPCLNLPPVATFRYL